MDHERIPFIDDKSSPQVFVEMENQKSHAKLRNTDTGGADIMDSSFATALGRSIDNSKQFDNADSEAVTGKKMDNTRRRTNSFKFPIHAAAEKGNVKKLEKLLVRGDPLVRDFKEKTPLHYACGFRES